MPSGPHDHGTFLPVLAPNPQAPGPVSRARLAGDRRRRLGEDLAVATLSLAGNLAGAGRRTRRLLAALTFREPQVRRGDGDPLPARQHDSRTCYLCGAPSPATLGRSDRWTPNTRLAVVRDLPGP
jgi:hypothetical protein